MDAKGEDGSQQRAGFGKKEFGILRTLLVFTVTMLIVPIIGFFLMKSFIFEGLLGYENGSLNAAIGTVVIIHIIIGWYIWLAIKEENEEQRLIKTE